MIDVDLNDADLRDRAVAAARGDAPFDLLIEGALVACPLTHSMRRADVGLVGALIASVHAPAPRDAIARIDATGCVLAPGFIDTHMHVESSMVTPAAYAAAMLPRGVTTALWDPHEFANVAGIAGVDYAMQEAEASAMRLLPLVPSCVPSVPGYETAGADFDADAIAMLLARPAAAGLAEVMDMSSVIARTSRMRGIVQAGLLSEKLVCGHARSLQGPMLQAYAAAGITSDHELTSVEDLKARIEAGLTVEIRGSHDHLLPDFAAYLQALPQLPPNITFCTDDVFPDDLQASGGLDDMMRRMIRYGLSPMRALKAATFNAATRLNRTDLGMIAAGRRADIVILDDLEAVRVRIVLLNGRSIDTTAPHRTTPQFMNQTMKCPKPAASDILPKAEGTRVRIATIDQPRFTRWGEAAADVVDGRVHPPEGTTLISVIHRHGRADMTPRTGFLTGWGKWAGAFGTTVSHDSHNLTLFGGSAQDIAVAAAALIDCGGGMVCVQNGVVTALLPLPIGGLVSDAPLQQVAEGFTALKTAMNAVVPWQPPYLVFKALVGATLACNAGPHQTDLGIADPMNGRLLATPVLGPA
ncbi:adenine deaminase [Falsirhodobacter sp. alg1]|uniref:adenine deaminase n=1 Tax=Falsirhodobacter sp. alg1 TaxID=1472418 RepID=UPI0009EC2FCC|nr:adenine deaminase C-terminal domain-containing protein [Falsirhodobacter sp. alg1]